MTPQNHTASGPRMLFNAAMRTLLAALAILLASGLVNIALKSDEFIRSVIMVTNTMVVVGIVLFLVSLTWGVATWSKKS